MEGLKRKLKKNGMTVLAALAALLPFASRLLWRSISIDTEQMINTPRQILLSWLYHERPGLVASKILFGQTKFLYNVEIIGAILFLTAACVAWAYFVRRASRQERSKIFGLLFPLLYLTHPAMTEQFHFLLQSMEVAWAVFLCLTAAGLVSEWLWQRRTFWRLPVGVAAMAWGFCSYQSLVALYIAAAAGLFILYYDSERTESGKEDAGKKTGAGAFWWKLAFCQAAVFALGFALSRAAAKAGLYLSTGSTEPTAYVAGMVKWGRRPATECLRELYHYGKQTLFGQGAYHSLAYLTAAAGTIAMLAGGWFGRGGKEQKNGKKRCGRSAKGAAYLLAGVVLYLSPFLLPLYLGGASQARAQMALPFVVAFGWCYLLHRLREKPFCAARLPAMAAACVFCAAQLWQTACLTRTAYEVYRQECILSREIAGALEEAGVPEGACVQFVGRWSPSPGPGMVRGETTGYSFYEWDAEKAYGSTQRILGLWETLGYRYTAVEPAAAPAGCERAAAMPCWPESGSVDWDGATAVVKLSPE